MANEVPFTDEELERIINARDLQGEIRWSSGKGERVWPGEDPKDFIWTFTHAGLRISDAALFNIKRLNGNEVFLRAKKNGSDVFAYLRTGSATGSWIEELGADAISGRRIRTAGDGDRHMAPETEQGL